MKRYADKIDAGVKHLRSHDPVIRALVGKCPPLTSLRLERNRFGSLANSILSQQVSIHSARSVRSRLLKRVGPGRLTPEGIGRLSVEELRAIGVSRPKARYLLDLAQKVDSGQVRLNRMGRLKDEQVVQGLVGVKGIGVWTAQMFLIFALGRMDVMPWDDFGVRAAIQRLYGLEELPNKKTCLEIAAPWRPYATIASWYCWRSHEMERGKKKWSVVSSQ